MQTRHRIPTIFSIYMVDVLCCALGCVVLLWQVNFQEAEEQTALAKEQTLSASSALENLAKANLDLEDKTKQILRLTLDLESNLNLALTTKKKYDDALKAKAQLEALLSEKLLDLDNLSKKHTDLAKKNEDDAKKSAAELAEQLRQNFDLSKKIKEAQLLLAGLEKDLLARKGEVTTAARKVEDQKALLELAEIGRRKLEAQLDELRILGKLQLARSGTLESDLDRSRKELLAIAKQYQELLQAHAVLSGRLTTNGKDLDISKDLATKLMEEKLLLLKQAANMRKLADSRFAGIALTGNRVVFLVDMSGSMELVDENTLDPDKWPTVANTVGQVMQSLPDLKQYQVVLFSDKIRYVLGTEGKWIDYDPVSSVKATVEAIKAVKPKGGTNMHLAFQETFRYRGAGLDTVYFFSDGLPTSGEGLPADRSKLTDTQITDILGRHIRNSLKKDWNQPLAKRPRVRINTIGFFYESPEVGAFLWALAREHDGSFVGMSRP